MYAAIGRGVTISTAQYVKLYQSASLLAVQLEAFQRLTYWCCSLVKVHARRAVSRWSFSALRAVSLEYGPIIA